MKGILADLVVGAHGQNGLPRRLERSTKQFAACGARGIAGEIGHVTVDDAGHMCRCGNRGCLETLVGAGALLDLIRRSHGPEITIEGMVALADVVEIVKGETQALADDGDPGCRRVIADAGHAIGRVVAMLCNQFNPERIVVGGELAMAGDLLLDAVREAIGRYAVPAAVEDLAVVAGALGDRAELMGALALVVGQSELVLSERLGTAAGG